VGDLFNAPLGVTIDIKPGSDANPINAEGKGVVPVAILGSDSFDVSAVDTAMVLFGPMEANPKHHGGHLEDVDLNGYMDLVFHFPVQDTGLVVGDTHACLDGLTLHGWPFQGCDTVTVVR